MTVRIGHLFPFIRECYVDPSPADYEPSETSREPLDASRNAFRPFRKPIDQSCHVTAFVCWLSFKTGQALGLLRECANARMRECKKARIVRTMMFSCRDSIGRNRRSRRVGRLHPIPCGGENKSMSLRPRVAGRAK